MSNSWISNNYNIDTTTTLSQLIIDTGHIPVGTDSIYIFNGATLTCDQNLFIQIIILGSTSGGDASSGNRFGVCDFENYTITFTGNSNSTLSGLRSNPISADTSSKGCLFKANSANFVNSTSTLSSSLQWGINCAYGALQFISCSFRYSYSNCIIISPLVAKTTNLVIIRGCTFGAMTKGSCILFNSFIDTYVDLRFNIIGETIYNPLTFIYFNFVGISMFSSGAIIDYAGLKLSIPEVAPWSIFYLGNMFGTFYIANDRITNADTRPTQIVPTGLTLTDTTTGKTLKVTITNLASYVDSDMFVLAKSDGTIVGSFTKADYISANYGYTWPVLNNGTSYQLKIRATSNMFTYSSYSALATATTPTAPGGGGSVIGSSIIKGIN